VRSNVLSGRSQSFTVVSLEPLTSLLPSGERARLLTLF
jgi:hypothetical protein